MKEEKVGSVVKIGFVVGRIRERGAVFGVVIVDLKDLKVLKACVGEGLCRR